ncbi:MAG: LysE family transporter [Pseudomonadota bacterium]
MADTLLILAGVALVHLAGAASPGPSFVVVARAAAARSRASGLWMSLGMGLGAAAWAAAALFGLAALFAAAPWLHDVVRLAGAAFLLWLSVQMIRHAQAPPDAAEGAAPTTSLAALRQATLVQLSNPKVMIFFASVFVAVVPPDAPPALLGLILLNVLLVEAAWYALVALAFSAGPIRSRYLAAKAWIDRICGGALGLIGLRLALG